MLDSIVEQFLGSGTGAQTITELGAHGLDPAAARGAITATAEGAIASAPGAGGIAGALSGLTGGAGGGLGGLLGGLAGGAPAASGGGLGGLLGSLGGGAAGVGGGVDALARPVAEFVASRTGLSPAMAQTVVGVVLPKVLQMLSARGN